LGEDTTDKGVGLLTDNVDVSVGVEHGVVVLVLDGDAQMIASGSLEMVPTVLLECLRESRLKRGCGFVDRVMMT
jgi:hypothetical protein